MRPFPQADRANLPRTLLSTYRRTAALLAALATVVWMAGCTALGSGLAQPATPTTPNTPAASVSVTVTPASADVLLGNSQVFTATVANTSDSSVIWTVNGAAGRNAAIGTISNAGVYTAPADLPSTATVQVTATSQADPMLEAGAARTPDRHNSTAATRFAS